MFKIALSNNYWIRFKMFFRKLTFWIIRYSNIFVCSLNYIYFTKRIGYYFDSLDKWWKRPGLDSFLCWKLSNKNWGCLESIYVWVKGVDISSKNLLLLECWKFLILDLSGFCLKSDCIYMVYESICLLVGFLMAFLGNFIGNVWLKGFFNIVC